jgi:mannosyltransferase OCH1-like enzyme
MIPKILHMIWVGNEEPPQYFTDNLNKWKELMPRWTFMVWTNDNLTVDYFEEDYLIMLKKIPNPAYVSDFIRFYILNKWGGYYLDADVTPIRNLEELPITKSLILCNDLPDESPGYIAIGFIASVPNHRVWEHCIRDYVNYADNQSELDKQPVGPIIIGRVIQRLYNQIPKDYDELPYWFFYRNRIGDPGPYMPDRVMLNHPGAFGNHFYAATWT